MSEWALVCSGQGTQAPEMLDFASPHAAGRAVLQEFSRVVGSDLASLVAAGQGLSENRLAQPLAVATAMANWAVLQPLLPPPQLVAGYSVGEVAAWACAGAWTAAEAAAVCRARAAAMDRFAPPRSGMLAVRGIPLAQIAAVATAADVHVAILNEDDHAVLAGVQPALAAAQAQLEAAGAWTRVLEVQVPSHTPLLQSAAREFAEWLRTQRGAAPTAAVVLGTSGAQTDRYDRGFPALAAAIAEPIRWNDCMQQLVDSGIRAVLELGPGRSLSNMLHQAHPQIACRAVIDFRTPGGVAAWVHGNLE